MTFSRLRWAILLLLACLHVSTPAAARAAAVRDDFETPEPSWIEAGGDARARILAHERSGQSPHSGHGCELFAFEAAPGATSLYLARDIGRAPVIPELTASLWLRSDCPAGQLLGRVVLPRSKDPQTGAPQVIFVRGGNYSAVGSWQQLSLDNVALEVTRQARLLRAQRPAESSAHEVDTREAYLDRLLVNVYSGGSCRVWIDDLSVGGLVEATPTALPVSAVGKLPERRTTIELNGSIFMRDGRPFFPRAIDYQGEPLSLLRQLGFNTVRFGQVPPANLLAEAHQLGLAIICPPPLKPVDSESAAAASGPIGPEFDAVIAWDVGRQLSSRELERTRRWSADVRRADTQIARPILCEPDAELRSYSRTVDVLALRREPLGTSFELADFGPWLRERPRLARPGTPVWTVVQTQASPWLVEQWRLLSGGAVGDVTTNPEQIRLLVYAALASGTRGICFQSRTSLAAADEATRVRAMGLELLNLELELVEPWAAAGNAIANVPGVLLNAIPVTPPQMLKGQERKNMTRSGMTAPIKMQPDVSGVVLQMDRGHLLLPIWASAGGQYVPNQSAGNGISFVVPGVPEANDVHEITPGGLRPVRHQRVAGGIRLTIDEFGMNSMVVLTQDPVVIHTLNQRLAQIGPRATQLLRELAVRKLQSATEVDTRLVSAGHPVDQGAKWLAIARTNLDDCEAELQQGNLREAFIAARRSIRPLNQIERAHWSLSIKDLVSPTSNPLSVTFATLPAYWRFVEAGKKCRWGRNRIIEGDFEDLDRMVWSGWQHFEHPQDGVETEAELSSAAPKAGRYSLRLSAKAIDERAAAGLVETSPVWITSPSVYARAGQWFRISGWIYAPVPIAGSLDGLLILDSCGGEPLAERFGEASSWKQFVLYRAAPRDGPVNVTIALTGYGEAWIDDVAIEPLLPAGVVEPLPDRNALTRLPPVR